MFRSPPRLFPVTLALLTAALTGLPAASAQDKCAIEGFVVDEEFVSLAGVSVQILGTKLDTETAASGWFEFPKVAVGSYTLEFSRLGYESATRSATCSADHTTQLIVVLEPIEVPGQPYVSSFEFEGRLACALGLLTLSTSDLCAFLGLDNSGKNLFEIVADGSPITGAVYEVEWTRTNALAGPCLALAYPLPRADNVTYETNGIRHGVASVVKGASPLAITLRSPGVDDPLHQPNPGSSLYYQVRATGSSSEEIAADPLGNCSSRVLLDQPFTLHVSLFHNGAIIPPGYTNLG